MITNLKQLKTTLENKGIKPTYQRLKILKYIEANKTHPTVDMIYENIVKEIPTISKTTVYNTLDTFLQKGLVTSVIITGTEVRFDRTTVPHHHFLCEKCGKIVDLNIECQYFKKGYVSGHKIKELHGYFKGICKNCLKKK